MPWHQSKSDPRKVYDAAHQAVCVCQNESQAALIVRAVNALGANDSSVRLREPAVTRKEVSAEVVQSASGAGQTAPLDTFDPDPCCGRYLASALRNTTPMADEWRCPKCGTLWRRSGEGPVRQWKPDAEIAIIRT